MKNPNPNQTVFDRALLALRKQGIASLSAGETCALRGQAGTKCAIGHLIPDDAYYEALEHVSGVGVVTGIDQALANTLEADVAKASVNLLADLQLAHDSHMPRPGLDPNRYGMGVWEVAMQNIAARHGLTYTAP